MMMAALQMNWHPQCRRTGPPLGLKNLGNSCYLNSVLQCLSYTPPLAQFCLSSQHSTLCKKVFANREKECPFCILERQIARSLSLDGPVDAPSKIQKCLALFAEHLCWGRQEDAHEFLRYVIDACHNACLKLVKRAVAAGASNGNGSDSGVAALSKGSSKAAVLGTEGSGLTGLSTVMNQIFGGALLSQVKCLACKGESNKIDEIMDICLDVLHSNSLKDALARFFQPEVLDGNNKYSCGSCKKLSVARKQMFILRAPNVLVIQLKRFEGIHGGKINKNIEFDEVLLLSKFMHYTSQEPATVYNLFGGIVHSGFSPESGHYYAYVKDASGHWYCCNDAHVSLSTTQQVLSDKVYILFYLRSSQNTNSNKLGSSCNGLKTLDTNGGDASALKPTGTPTNIKSNGVSSKNNGSIMLKNGKVPLAVQIKQITSKNLETKKFTSNGNGNLGVQKKAACGMISVSPESSEETKISNQVGTMLAPNGGKSVEHSIEKPLPVQNENGCINTLEKKAHEENNIKIAAAVKVDFISDSSFKDASSEHDRGASTFNKELCKNSTTEISVAGTEEACMLEESHTCKEQKPCGKRHFKEEFEKFKEMLAGEAFSQLHSSGWVNKVEKLMRARKRFCQQAVDTCSDSNSLKKQLVIDARKACISQIPESLKERLIELLRVYCQEKPILDA